MRPERLSWIISLFVIVYLLLPLVALIPIAFTSAQYVSFPPPGFSLQWFEGYAFSNKWLIAALVSLRVGLFATGIATVLGTMGAWVIVRGKFAGKWLFEIMVTSPLFIPYIVLALGLYFVYAKAGLLNTITGIALGHAVLGTPLVVIVVSAALRGVDPALEQAAASLGASKTRIAFTIILPLVAPGVVAGSFLAFLVSWDELLIPLFVGSVHEQTLPRLLWVTIRAHYSPGVAAVSVLLFGVSTLMLIGVILLKNMGNKMFGKSEIRT